MWNVEAKRLTPAKKKPFYWKKRKKKWEGERYGSIYVILF
jgi:hypothetical protein